MLRYSDKISGFEDKIAEYNSIKDQSKSLSLQLEASIVKN